MLKYIEYSTVIAALVVVAGLFVLMFFYASPRPASQAPQQQHGEKYEAKENGGEANKSLWEKARTDPIAFFTLWLVLFTAVLSGVGVIQLSCWGALKR